MRNVYNQIAAWHQQYGDRWAPSRLLRELAETVHAPRGEATEPFVTRRECDALGAIR